MRRFIYFLIILFISLYIGLQLEKDSGYVLISFKHWTIETTLWFAIIAIVLLYFSINLIRFIYKKLSSLPLNLFKIRKKWAHQRSHDLTRRGLIEFTEGNWHAAENLLIKAIHSSESPLINYLAAARAAQEQGNYKRRDHYLRQAQKTMPDAKVAVELTQAQLQLSINQQEQALATLKHLHVLLPKHPYVIKLLLGLYIELKDYHHLIELLPKIKKNRIVSSSTLSHIELYAYQGFLLTTYKHGDAKKLQNTFENLPKEIKSQPLILSLYAKLLIQSEQHDKSEELIRNALKKQWHDRLAYLYGKCLSSSPQSQLEFAYKLLKSYPQKKALFQTLGILNARLQLWGKAREYFSHCITLSPSPECYYELAKISLILGEKEKQCHYLKQGIDAALNQKQKDELDSFLIEPPNIEKQSFSFN